MLIVILTQDNPIITQNLEIAEYCKDQYAAAVIIDARAAIGGGMVQVLHIPAVVLQ